MKIREVDTDGSQVVALGPMRESPPVKRDRSEIVAHTHTHIYIT